MTGKTSKKVSKLKTKALTLIALTLLSLTSASKAFAQDAGNPVYNLNGPIPTANARMIVTTTMNVDGYRVVDYKGVVRGMIVRQPTIMQGFKASFKSIVGGTMGSYSEMCEQARTQAYESMVAKAAALGANAIVGMRYDSTAFNASATDMGCEIVAYGTAVTIEPIK